MKLNPEEEFEETQRRARAALSPLARDVLDIMCRLYIERGTTMPRGEVVGLIVQHFAGQVDAAFDELVRAGMVAKVKP